MTLRTAALLGAALLAAPAATAHAGQTPPPQPGPDLPEQMAPDPSLRTLTGVDLTISSISGPRCPSAGQPIGSELEVKIENRHGGSVSHDFSIRFDIFHIGQALGPTPLDQARQSVDGIGSQTTKIVELTDSLAIPAILPFGPAELIVEVDPDDNVEETDETNNTERFTMILEGQNC